MGRTACVFRLQIALLIAQFRPQDCRCGHGRVRQRLPRTVVDPHPDLRLRTSGEEVHHDAPRRQGGQFLDFPVLRIAVGDPYIGLMPFVDADALEPECVIRLVEVDAEVVARGSARLQGARHQVQVLLPGPEQSADRPGNQLLHVVRQPFPEDRMGVSRQH